MKFDNSLLPPLDDLQSHKRIVWMDVSFIILLLLSAGVILPLAINKLGLFALVGVFGIILSVGVFFQPEIGMLAYLLITYTQFSNVAITTYGFPSIIQPLAGLMLLIMLIRARLYGERPLSGSSVVKAMVPYVFFWTLPLLITNNFAIISEALIFNAKRVLGGIIVMFFIRRPETIRRAIWTLIISGILMGTISAYQNITGTYENDYWGFGKWLRAEDANMYTRNRLTGPYGDPNPYAQVLVVVVVLAFERFLHEKQNVLRLIAGWAVVVCILTVFFTYSRGSGFLNLIFTMGVFISFFRQRILIPSIIVLVFGILLSQFLPSTYLVRIDTLSELLPSSSGQITDQSFLHRLNENTASWEMFLDHPLIGVGIGNFPYMYTQYGAQSGYSASAGPVASPSLYAEVLSEQGLLGTTVFFMIIYYIFRDLLLARKLFEAVGRSDLANMATAFFSAMAGYMFSGLFKQSAYSNAFWVLVGVAVAFHQVAQNLYTAARNAPDDSSGLVVK